MDGVRGDQKDSAINDQKDSAIDANRRNNAMNDTKTGQESVTSVAPQRPSTISVDQPLTNSTQSDLNQTDLNQTDLHQTDLSQSDVVKMDTTKKSKSPESLCKKIVPSPTKSTLSSEEGTDYLSELPVELLRYLTRFLDGFTMCNLAMTSKMLRQVCCSMLEERGMVVLQWEKRHGHWDIAYKVSTGTL